MRAAVVEELRKPLQIRDVPDPSCAADGAIVRVGANGICRTDWHLWTGDWASRGVAIEPPFVLGHEFSGTIEEVGRDVRAWKRGDRVVFPMNPGDGTCDLCRSGQTHVCEVGLSLVPGVAYWGAFAEYVAVRHADVNLVRVPEALSFVDTCGMACRYAAAFRGVVDLANVRAGEWVAVFGAGGMGAAAVQVAAAVGGRVIAVDPQSDARTLAASLGAVHTLDPASVDPVEAIRELTRGGVHVAIDALGIHQTCQSSVLSLRNQGRQVQLGHTTRRESGYVPMPIDLILNRELRIFGGFGLPAHRYGEMMRLAEASVLEPGKTVQRCVPLTEASAALEAMGSYGTTGAVVIDRF